MKFDDVLKHHAGEFGLFSKLMVAMVCWEEMTFTWQIMAAVFIAAVPPFRCVNSEIPQQHNFTSEFINNLTVPWEKTRDGAIVQDQCYRYSRNYSLHLDNLISLDYNGTNDDIIPCSSWAYDHSQLGETIVSQWNAVCSNAWMASTVAAVFLGGRSVGNFIFGWFADRYGRKKTILVAGITNLAAAVASIVSPNYYFFLVTRFLHATLATGKSNCGFVYAVEVTGPSYRVWAASLYMYSWSFAVMLLAGIAYLERFLSWRYLLITILIPEVFYYPLVYLFMPESPRWLYLVNKREEADEVMKKILRLNKATIPKDFDEEIFEPEKSTLTRSPLDLFRTPGIRMLTIILIYNWAANGFVYYGLSMNIGMMGGNAYINVLITGVMDVFVTCFVFFAFKRYGRIWPYSSCMVIGGIAQLLIAAVPKGVDWAIVTLAMTGRFFISTSFTMAWIYSTEVYPTAIRNLGLTVTAIGARLSSPISPYIALLGKNHPVLPYIIFGVLSITAGLLVLLLPEIKDIPLPQTIEDGEKLIRNNKVKLAFWKRKIIHVTEEPEAHESREAMIEINSNQKMHSCSNSNPL